MLYVIYILFGLGYGGIISMYAFIAREYFPITGLARRIAIIYLFGTIGMALGGWLGGFVFDTTGTYRLAFLVGVIANVVNLVLIGTLIYRAHIRPATMKRA